jgi:Icc-related predicted phosphoesterase
VKIAIISDVHCKQKQVIVPECDLLISCGDYSFLGEAHVVKNYHKWLNKQPAKHIISIQGNHEKWVEKNYAEAKEIAIKACPRVHFIQDESVVIEGLNVYGNAYTPYFFNWAWNAGRDIVEASHTFKPFIGDIWAKIPENTDILVTHGPPLGILDEVADYNSGRIISVGCRELLKKINQLPNLKLNCFGHLHLRGGMLYQRDDGKIFVNASVCDEQYKPVNKPVVVNL